MQSAGRRNRRRAAFIGGNEEGAVRVELAAGQIVIAVNVGHVVQVKAGLGIAEVHVVTGQQTVALRSHIAHLQDQILGQLALDIQVVLG